MMTNMRLLVTLLIVSLFLTGCSRTSDSRPQAKDTQDRPEAKKPQELDKPEKPVINQKPATPTASPSSARAVLAAGLRVSGSATLKEVQREQRNFDRTLRYSFNQVRLRLELKNTTDLSLKLGNTLMVMETDAKGETLEGVLAGFRLPKEPEFSKEEERWDYRMAYGLPTVESRFEHGRRFTRVGTMSFDLATVVNNTEWQDASKDDTVPVELTPKANATLAVTFNRCTWLKGDSRQALRLALPEVTVRTEAGLERYRLLVTFQKSNAETESWEVSKTDLIHLAASDLEPLVLQAKGDLILETLAANWWVEIEPKIAFPVMARRGKTLRQGKLLDTLLDLSTRHKDASMKAHAQDLLAGSATHLGVSLRAAHYLANLGEDPDISPLLAAARDKDDELAASVIFGIGRLKTPRAIAGLRQLLNDPTLSHRHRQIQANLDYATKKEGP